MFNALKEKVCKPSLLYLAKADIEGEIKILTYK